MEVNNVYLDEEIINIFFDLLDFKSKINFTKINKTSFSTYKDKVRNEIFNYINNDYLLFYECLKRFRYTEDEKLKLMKDSLNVNTVLNVSGRFCDLRFIFELCYYSKKSFYVNICTNGLLNDRKILELMIKEIFNSMSFNRYETILNIEKRMILYSLKRSFKPIFWKTNDARWTYLIKE